MKSCWPKTVKRASRFFRKHHENIDMVLLDMSMPKKSGREAFIMMKEIDENVKCAPDLGISEGWPRGGDLSLGVRGFIQNPTPSRRFPRQYFKPSNGALDAAASPAGEKPRPESFLQPLQGLSGVWTFFLLITHHRWPLSPAGGGAGGGSISLIIRAISLATP